MKSDLIIFVLLTIYVTANGKKSENKSKSDRSAPLSWLQVEPYYIQPPTSILSDQATFLQSHPTPIPQTEFSYTSQIYPNGPKAENIRCNNAYGNQIFTALLRIPNGFNSSPTFRDADHLNSQISECVMKKSMHDNKIFYMNINNFNRCGVTVHSNNDKTWMTVTIRFPHMQGLILAQDEYIMLICQQQDRRASKKHFLNFRGNLPSITTPIFRNLPNEFEYDIGLFTKSLMNNRFEVRVIPGKAIPVGQEVQLRAVISSGKGWKYAAVTDVVVHRLPKSQKFPASNSPLHLSSHLPPKISEMELHNINTIDNNLDEYHPDGIYLIFENGCRNPMYSSIAAHHPFVDPLNPLIISFNFEAFMFEGMKEDFLRISTTVIACMEYDDCQKNLCQQDEGKNYRNKRHSFNFSQISVDPTNKNKITKELDMKVIVPEYIKVFEENSSDKQEPKRPFNSLFVIILSIINMIFSVSVAVIIIVTRKKIQHHF